MTCKHSEIRGVCNKNGVYQCQYCGELLTVGAYTKEEEEDTAAVLNFENTCIHCLKPVAIGDGILADFMLVDVCYPNALSHLECYLDCRDCNPE